MVYRWYLLFNRADFEDLGLVSRTYTLELEGLGLKDILATQGNLLGITYEGIFLPVKLNERNPYAIDGHAVYENDDGQIYLGVPVES